MTAAIVARTHISKSLVSGFSGHRYIAQGEPCLHTFFLGSRVPSCRGAEPLADVCVSRAKSAWSGSGDKKLDVGVLGTGSTSALAATWALVHTHTSTARLLLKMLERSDPVFLDTPRHITKNFCSCQLLRVFCTVPPHPASIVGRAYISHPAASRRESQQSRIMTIMR